MNKYIYHMAVITSVLFSSTHLLVALHDLFLSKKKDEYSFYYGINLNNAINISIMFATSFILYIQYNVFTKKCLKME